MKLVRTGQLGCRQNQRGIHVYCPRLTYRVSKDLRLIPQDLIPEAILSQKYNIHMGPIHNGYRTMNIYSKLNKVEKKEVHCVFIENSC
jgi:hypothetical protein